MLARIASGAAPVTVGRRSALPMLPRSAFHENGLADAPVTNAPVAPPASADRSSAPTLPGILHVGDRENERVGSRAEAGRVVHVPQPRSPRCRTATAPGSRRRRRGRPPRPLAGRAAAARARAVRLRGHREARRGDENHLEAESGVERFAHEMRAVEQHAPPGRDRGRRPARGTRRRRDCGGSRWCAQNEDRRRNGGRKGAGRRRR